MLNWIAALLLIIISYSLLRLGLWIIEVRNLSQRQYVEASREFFKHVDTLLLLDDLTETDIEFIDDLVSTINDKSAAMAYLYVLQKKEARRKAGIQSSNNSNLAPLSMAHTDEFYKCIHSWFSAITANSPVFGALIRVTIDQQKIAATSREVSHKVNTNHRFSKLSKILAHA